MRHREERARGPARADGLTFLSSNDAPKPACPCGYTLGCIEHGQEPYDPVKGTRHYLPGTKPSTEGKALVCRMHLDRGATHATSEDARKAGHYVCPLCLAKGSYDASHCESAQDDARALALDAATLKERGQASKGPARLVRASSPARAPASPAPRREVRATPSRASKGPAKPPPFTPRKAPPRAQV